MSLFDLPQNSAVISPCGLYRYRLVRELGGTTTVVFVMVNPSTADADKDDNTIRKCIKFARLWGFGRLVVVNLFAYRATDVSELGRAVEPIGIENDAYIQKAAKEADLIVFAWGAREKLPPALRYRPGAVASAIKVLGYEPHCIRTTADGSPEHPLFLPGNLVTRPWPAERGA